MVQVVAAELPQAQVVLPVAQAQVQAVPQVPVQLPVPIPVPEAVAVEPAQPVVPVDLVLSS
jgi:hypothetical protein